MMNVTQRLWRKQGIWSALAVLTLIGGTVLAADWGTEQKPDTDTGAGGATGMTGTTGTEGQQTTLTGKLVNLHTYMTRGPSAYEGTGAAGETGTPGTTGTSGAGGATGMTGATTQPSGMGMGMLDQTLAIATADQGLVILSQFPASAVRTPGGAGGGMGTQGTGGAGGAGDTSGATGGTTGGDTGAGGATGGAGTGGATGMGGATSGHAMVQNWIGKNVQITGRLYNRGGLKYVEVQSISQATGAGGETGGTGATTQPSDLNGGAQPLPDATDDE